MNFDRLKGRIVAADTNGERLLVTIQLDKIEPVGVGARVQIVSHLFWPDVERLLQAIEKVAADALNLAGEVGAASTRANRLDAKLSASEREVERLRDALESRDLMIETLQRALGPDKVLEAFGFDRERIENARRQIADGKFITLDQLKAEIAERAALRGEEASRG